MSLAAEVARRRTFAIISHPDAGKTTLTEKLLLFAGAIQIAGSVKARKASRHATSDWMEIEKQRGISVASSVMQMEYRDCVINLLDTPGHQDFSEDTYRVLTAVDAALMVIDAANGVEAQTLRLIEVCRARNTPILTFINKLDREVREPLDLLDEIERTLGMPCAPLTWPVGQGKHFHGIYDLRTERMRVFRPGADRRGGDDEIVTDPARPARSASAPSTRPPGTRSTWCATRRPPSSRDDFLAAHQTPVFFGSAINNFGVREVLDALVDLAPAPAPRQSHDARSAARGGARSPAWSSRSRPTWTRRTATASPSCASARASFERGMRLNVHRTGKELRPTGVVTFLSQRRDRVEEAYAGDIIGIVTHGGLQLGDTVTDGEPLQYTGLPFFAPELFRTVELADPMRSKQLCQGPAGARRGGRHPGVPPGGRQPDAARRRRPAAVRSRRSTA